MSEYRVARCSDNVEVNGLSEYRDKIKSRSFDGKKKYPINSTVKSKLTKTQRIREKVECIVVVKIFRLKMCGKNVDLLLDSTP